jgi:hypothetical protein
MLILILTRLSGNHFESAFSYSLQTVNNSFVSLPIRKKTHFDKTHFDNPNLNSVQFEMQSDTCPGLSAEGGVQYCIMIKVTVGEGAAGELEQQEPCLFCYKSGMCGDGVRIVICKDLLLY